MNQIVAANVRRAMGEAGWGYGELATRLARHGVKQSRQNLHKKVRSETGKQAAFTANELLAFSLAFGLPIAWFLLPQPHHKVVGPGENAPAIPTAQYLDRLFVDAPQLRERLTELGREDDIWRETAALYERFVAVQLGELGELGQAVQNIAERFASASASARLRSAFDEKDRERAAMSAEERAKEREELDEWMRQSDERRARWEQDNEALRREREDS